MKVVFFIPSLNARGGVERSTVNLLNSLAEESFLEVELVVFEPLTNDAFELHERVLVTVIGVTNYKLQYFKVLYSLFFMFRARADIVVTVETMSLLFSMIPVFFLKGKVKHIVWEHFNFKNNNGRKIRGWLRYLSAMLADLIVLLTERDVDEWVGNLKVRSSVKCIYNITPFESGVGSYDVLSRKVLSVGRYTSVKGFDRLVEIWRILQTKYDVAGWELYIVGYGEKKDSILNLIDRYKLQGIYLKQSDDVSEDYRNASFYCLTSYFEGLPMVLIEAQSFSLPCIAFDIFTGPSEIISDASGILVEDGDLAAYAKAMYALMMDESLRSKMSMAACEEGRRFSQDKIVKEWLEAFHGVLDC